ncbi:alkaline phosphatase family protein [Haladaptatus cibarius]|uniref:alkaline phosphatase family protein n=1 Tax=Haladaptatus cibarius TaxID=453847 RepID=UPI00067852BB|nr:alkaline phosphatase family protein [Haladaptatus cibarius]
MSRTVYTVGLDGAPPSLVDRGIREGRLPTLAQIRDGGIEGTTRSTRPPLSMMAWSTFATGKSPGNHGIYNFILKNADGYDVEFADSKHLRENSIPVWEYLDANGYPTGVMNVMPGYPPSETDGFHLSDHITTPPGACHTYPNTIESEIDSLVDEYEVGPLTGYGPGDGADSLDAYVEDFFHIEENRVAVVKHLIEEHPARAMFLVFSGPDIFLHEVGHLLDSEHPKYEHRLANEYGDAPLDLLSLYDDFLGWLVETMDDDDVLMVLSDHGHGPVYKAVNLNSWLYQNDYLSLESGALTRLKTFGYNYLFDAVETALKKTNLYDHLKLMVARSSGEESDFDMAGLLTISQGDIDWSETTAFTVAGDGQLFINGSRNGSDGVVPASKYDSFRDELRTALLGMADPATGDTILEAVLPGEDVYEGRYTETRPDLVCIPKPTYRLKFPQTMKTNQFLVKPQKWASHTSESEMDGIFYMWGDDVEPQSDVQVRLADYAPTTMHLLGSPVPTAMDGDVRTDLLANSRSPDLASYDGKVHTKRAVRSVTDGIVSD